MLVEVVLDASEMEPPEPFDRATGILRELEPGQYLRMLHRRMPYPLLEFCQAMSLTYTVIVGAAAGLGWVPPSSGPAACTAKRLYALPCDYLPLDHFQKPIAKSRDGGII